jgi:ribosomal protein L14E/L6E/L27E
MKLGEIVLSVAGRDAGKHFAVAEIVDDNHVRIADGDLRRIKTAKLKKIKHLKTSDETLDKIAEKLENGLQVFDSELKSAIRVYNEKNTK